MLILTVADIFDRVFTQLRENGADPIHWSKSEFFKYINDGLMDIAEKAMCFKQTVGIEVKSGQRRYLIPKTILVPERIEWDGEFLDEAGVEDLDNHDSSWRVRTGDPKVWFVELCPPGYIDLFRVPDTDGDDTDFSSDYGVISDISDGTNTFTFSSEYGIVTAVSSDGNQVIEMDDDYGVTTGWFSESGNLTIIGLGYPDSIENENDTLPRPIHGNYEMMVNYITYRALLKEGPGLDVEKAAIFRAAYMEARNTVRVRPKTSTRRRFVRRVQNMEIQRVIGPGVPATIET